GERGPYRAVEDDLRGDTAPRWKITVCALRVGAHRRHDQPSRGEQIRLLDQRETARDRRGVVQGRQAAPWILVERLDRLVAAVPGSSSCGARSGQSGRQNPRPRDRGGTG